MALKLSDLDPNEVEHVGNSDSSIGRAPNTGLKLSDLNPDEIEHVEPEADPSKSGITAAMTGVIQGAVPFASALAGAGRAGMNAITGVTGPLGGGDLSEIVDDYRNARDSFAKDAKASQSEHPYIGVASNIAGGLSNPLFKGADTLGKVAGASAIQGLGNSEADLTKGEVEDAVVDTALGTAGGMFGYGVGKAIPSVAGAGKNLVKKALTTLGPSEEAINARLAGKALPSAKSYPELAEDMGKSLKTIKNQISDASELAAQTLSNEPNIPKEYVTSPIDDAIKAQGKLIGKTDKSVNQALNELKEDISQLGDTVSQKDIKSLIKKMDDNINWDDQSQNKLNTVLEGLRNSYDKTLKFQNADYKAAMKPVSTRMAVLNNIKRQFNFRNIPGEGLQPTDTTATKVQTALRDNKAVTQKNLERLKGFTGQDFQDLAKDYQLSQQFENTGPNGARRTALGAAIGGLFGHGNPVAIGIGAGAGATLDRYGGKAVGSLIDSYLKAGNSKAFGKFAPLIEASAKRSPEALAVTASMLSQNPEFKKLIETLQPPKP